MLLFENRRDLAMILHQRASELDPFIAALFEAQGWHWVGLRNYRVAEENFEKAIKYSTRFYLCLHITRHSKGSKGWGL